MTGSGADHHLPGLAERSFEPARRWAEAHVPHLEDVGIPAGHAVNLEAPGEFDAAVTAFLSRYC